MKCRYCGNELRSGERFCRKCGKPAEAESVQPPRFCIECGAELLPNAGFCRSCGAPVSQQKPEQPQQPNAAQTDEKAELKRRTEILVIAAQGGDSESFAKLYELYHQKVFALAKTTVKSDADAEDVLQMTFIKAWDHLDRLKDTSAFSTWIQRITLNQCYSLLRKQHATIPIDNDDEDSEPIQIESDLMLPEVYAEQNDLKKRLGKIIDELSDVQKQTITLYYFDGLPVENIAWIMDCSVNTVKSRLFLARKSIKTEIEEQERKSGQPFYGIVGLATIPFGQFFVAHVKASSLSQTAASALLKAIAGKISQSASAAAKAGLSAAVKAGTSAAAKGAANAGAKTAAAAGTKAAAGAGAKTAAAVGASVSKKVIAGIVAGTLAVGTVAGGTVATVKIVQNNRERKAAESATTVVTDGTFPSVTASDPFLPQDPSDGLSAQEREAYRAYLDCLIENKAGIDNYIWQKGYTLMYDENENDVPLTDENLSRPVALCDVYGDELPELIYVGDVEPGEWIATDWGSYYQNDSEAYLHIVTYRDDELVTLYNDVWDGWGDSWNGYHFFQTDGSKTLYATESNGDLSFWDYVYCFTEGADGMLHEEQVCLVYEDEDDGMLYYSKKDQRISESECRSILQSLSENTTEVLMYSRIGIPEFRSAMDRCGCPAMTADEAIAYLKGLLDGQTDTASYADAFSAYHDYLVAHKEGIDNYLWQIGGWESYYEIEEGTDRFVLLDEPTCESPRDETRSVALYDIYGDATPELIYIGDVPSPVKYTSHSTLNVLTYQDGRLVSLFSGEWDYPVYEESIGFVSLLVRPDGTLFYHYSEGSTYDSMDYYETFVMDGDGKLHREFALKYIHDSFEYEEGDGSPVVEEWYGPNQTRITKEEYEARLKVVAPEDSILLFDRYSYAGFAMNADEAIAFLGGQDAERIAMYRAYLSILEQSDFKEGILAFENSDRDDSRLPVLLRDVYGDELPELFILRQGEPENAVKTADLMIVTFEDGKTRTIFSDRFSYEDGECYVIEQKQGEKKLFLYHSIDPSNGYKTTISVFEQTEQGMLNIREMQVFEDAYDPDVLDSVYRINGKVVSSSEYYNKMLHRNTINILSINPGLGWMGAGSMYYREAIVLMRQHLMN